MEGIEAYVKNRYTVRGETTTVYLERRQGPPLELTIDTPDLARLDAHEGSWYAIHRPRSNTYYALGYQREPNGHHAAFYLHRYLVDAKRSQMVDPRDGNGMNCRRENLKITSRHVSHRRLRGPNANSTSGIRGVTWDANAKKWRAQVQVSKFAKKYLGIFDDKYEAGQVVQDFLEQRAAEREPISA